MKFIVKYGCSVGTESLAVEASSIETAANYAELSAFEYREGYEGLHGVQDFAEYCEENGYDVDDCNAYERYQMMVEEEIYYEVHPYDPDNIEDVGVYIDCNCEWYEI